MTNEEKVEILAEQNAELMGRIAQIIETQANQQEQIVTLMEQLTDAFDYINKLTETLGKNNIY
jgi:methyl-accepting chemotaxis protein